MIRAERRERDRTRIPYPTGGARTRTRLSGRTLGLAMKEQRQLAGISVFDMAGRCGVLTTQVLAWERGANFPPIVRLYEYAAACGVSLREVLP